MSLYGKANLMLRCYYTHDSNQFRLQFTENECIYMQCLQRTYLIATFLLYICHNTVDSVLHSQAWKYVHQKQLREKELNSRVVL